MIDKIFYQQDVRVVIEMSMRMMEKAKETARDEILKREPRNDNAGFEGGRLFRPDMSFATCYSENGNLFM
jgi:hypothetical protein